MRSVNRQGQQPSGNRIILVILLLMTGAGIYLYARIDDRAFESASMYVSDRFTSAMAVVSGSAGAVVEVWKDFRLFVDQRGEVRRLRSEIGQLQQWREVAAELERENARLRALNDIRVPPRTHTVSARIVGGSQGPFRHSAIADAGTDIGIADGSSVLDRSGLVGRVVGLGKRSARILFLTDVNSRVPVRIHPSGGEAVMAGDGRDQPRLIHFTDLAPVAVGDRITTSGSGGVYPAALPVGRIASVGAGEVRVSLAVNYGELAYVRILEPAPMPEIGPPALVVAPQSAAIPPEARDAP